MSEYECVFARILEQNKVIHKETNPNIGGKVDKFIFIFEIKIHFHDLLFVCSKHRFKYKLKLKYKLFKLLIYCFTFSISHIFFYKSLLINNIVGVATGVVEVIN